MSNFTATLANINVALTKYGVMTTSGFENINISEVLEKLKNPTVGGERWKSFFAYIIKNK